VSRSEVTTSDIKPYGVTGEVLDVKGRQSLSFELGGKEFHHSFLVCSLPTEAAGILDTDFLTESGAIIDLECNKMTFGEVSVTSRVRNETRDGRTALTVFSKGKEGHSPQPSPRKALLASQSPEFLAVGYVGICEGARLNNSVDGIKEIVLGPLTLQLGQSRSSKA